MMLASPPELNSLLTQFYVEVRRKDGTDYSKSVLRFGLCRFIKAHRPEIDIVSSRKQIAYLRLK